MHLQSVRATRVQEALATPVQGAEPIQVLAEVRIPVLVVVPTLVLAEVRIPVLVVVPTLVLAVLATLVLVVQHTTNGTVRLRIVNSVNKVRRNTEMKGKLREDKIRRVLERYRDGLSAKRYMTSFYCDPKWPDTPERVLVPYVAGVIKAWAGKVQ